MKDSRVPVSVVIPAYQAASYLGQTLAGVKRQTVTVDEVIVVDDGSSDRTAEIAESWGARVIRHGRNRGASAARNTGIQAAAYDWIALLDADDVWKPKKIERQWAVANRNPDVRAVFTDREHVRDGRVVKPRYLPDYERYSSVPRTPLQSENAYRLDGMQLGKALLPGNFILPSTLVLRTDLFEDIGRFDETFTAPDSPISTCEDHDLSLRLSVLTDPAVIEEPLVSYRLRDDGLSSDSIGMKLGYAYLAKKIMSDPTSYPPNAVDYFRDGRPDWLRSAAVQCMHADRFELAQRLLQQSLRERLSPRTLLAWILCRLGPPIFNTAARLKRVVGLPGIR